VFLAVVLVVGAGIAYVTWWSRQPRRMTGNFNIAVAEFVQTGEADPVASIVSQRIFSFLDGQYSQISFENVQVVHNKIGVIVGAEEASTLAEKIDAHVVVYGDVTVIDDQVLVTPQFYVVESHQSDVGELSGEQELAACISLPKEDLVNPSPEALKKMEESSKILTEFTKALVYSAAGRSGDLELARESIEAAIAEGESYGDFAGKEVLYLIASDIARRQKHLNEAQAYLGQAKALNENYGRGYVAEANIYYDQGNLYKAIKVYGKAKELKDQPFGAYIVEKASWGIGNSYMSQFGHVIRNEPVDWTGAIELANCALDNYQVVIDSYLQRSSPEASLREAAAWAYYYSGVIYQETEQGEIARQVLEQASRLTDNPDLAKKARDRLDELRK